MRKHSKKNIQKLHNYILDMRNKENKLYLNAFYSEGDPFAALFILTKHSFTIIGIDWTDRGSKTYYFRTFEQFMKIFREETLYRIPLFQLINLFIEER